MIRERVSLVEAGDDIQKAVTRSIALIGGLGLKGGERVVVKPNLCNAKNPYGMVTTDFAILEAVICLVRKETDNITVVESDNISDTADNRAARSGLLDKLDDLSISFMNLTRDDHEVHEVAGKKLRLPRTVLDAEYFVNLPKIKTEGHVSVTLSIKNLFGVLQRRKKSVLHRRLNEILPYLAKTVRHDLIVVDGLVAMEGNGPIIGTPREMGIVIAGRNPVSVDAFCARLMCFDPSEILHIIKSHEMGLGELDPEVLGDSWQRFVCEFDRPYSLKASLKSIGSIKKVYFPG
ncbi:MAG: DUF362 domain-containing protein [Candidatus Bathyarchaeota archaeon]|nr:DUF362 domain-containing protein [Candidatus Bathyarchaeota archaeon]